MHAKIAAVFIVGGLVSIGAQERIDHETYWKIRQEATTNSQILKTVQVLADLYGPRPTGSPNLKGAGEWAIRQMESWGLQNGRLEPWEWGNPGWLNERLSAHIISPVKDHLVAEALAWTPGTNGPVRAAAVQITLPVRPTKEVLSAHLEALKSTVKGKIVLVGAHQRVPVTFNDPPERRDDREVLQILAAPAAAQGPARASSAGAVKAAGGESGIEQRADRSAALSVPPGEWRPGACERCRPRSRTDPRIRQQHLRHRERRFRRSCCATKTTAASRDCSPTGRTVELEFDIVNRIYPEGRTSYNTIAEIPGTTDEVVMLGGHLDSWHAATGATDNAIGCAVVMEAARILKAIGVKPRRTIRVALWSGEEQGLRGSRAYIKQQFGTFEEPEAGVSQVRRLRQHRQRNRPCAVDDRFRPADRGDGGSRGDRAIQGSRRARRERPRAAVRAAIPTIRRSTKPGCQASTSLQDPIEYDSHTWHSNLDTYERVVEEDVIKSAIVIAATVYHLATRDEPLPRLSKGRCRSARTRAAMSSDDVAQLARDHRSGLQQTVVAWHEPSGRGSARHSRAGRLASGAAASQHLGDRRSCRLLEVRRGPSIHGRARAARFR